MHTEITAAAGRVVDRLLNPDEFSSSPPIPESKGEMVAKAPGSVSSKKGSGSAPKGGMKGAQDKKKVCVVSKGQGGVKCEDVEALDEKKGRAKKMLGAIAQKPGGVKYGKK
jgi:hypothetical protein